MPRPAWPAPSAEDRRLDRRHAPAGARGASRACANGRQEAAAGAQRPRRSPGAGGPSGGVRPLMRRLQAFTAGRCGGLVETPTAAGCRAPSRRGVAGITHLLPGDHRGSGSAGRDRGTDPVDGSVTSSGTEILSMAPEGPLAVRPGGRSPRCVRPAGLGAAARAARRRRAAAGAVRAGRRGPLTLPLASGRGWEPAAGTQVSPLDDAHNELLKFGRQSRNLDPDNSPGQSAEQTINERRAGSLDVAEVGLNLVGRRHLDDSRCRLLTRRERDSVGGRLHYVCRHGHGRRGPACAMARPAGLRVQTPGPRRRRERHGLGRRMATACRR